MDLPPQFLEKFRLAIEQDDASLAKWSSFMTDSYVNHLRPIIGTTDLVKLDAAAREKLKHSMDAFMYAFGNAGTGLTGLSNRNEFGKWLIVPRVLRDLNARNLETRIFGTVHPSPLLVAPMGVQGILHPDGELATAAAAARVGVPYVMSTTASHSIEAIAKANRDGHRWYQLYWSISKEVNLSLMSRAKTNEFSVLVVTLDTMLLGFRPHDLDTAYFPMFHGVGCQVGFTDPAFMAKHGLKPFPDDDTHSFPYDPVETAKKIRAGDSDLKQRADIGCKFMGELGVFRQWEDLKFIRENWEGPLVLKGILSVEDAELAILHGADGVIVSNHGGRQVDGAISALLALERIMKSEKVRTAQAAGKFTVLFDSGIRSGSDILKAIALGAQGVLCGRPLLYGLIVAGEAGVEYMLRNLLADTELTLGLSGYSNLDEIRGQPEKVMIKSE